MFKYYGDSSAICQMDLCRLCLDERLRMRFLRIPCGDFRQRDEIEAWVEGLYYRVVESGRIG